MKTAVVLFLLHFLSPGLLVAQELRAWISLPARPDAESKIYVQSFLVNDSEKILRFATRGTPASSVRYHQADGDIVVLYTFDDELDLEGRRVVRPESDYGLVELRKGEAALIGTEVLALESLGKENTKVVVEYHVTRVFASEYNVWSGRLKTVARIPAVRLPSQPERVPAEGGYDPGT